MKPLLIAATFGVCAAPVDALSCRFGDASVAYHQADANGDDFVAVAGTLEWLIPEDALHSGGLVMAYEGQPHFAPAHFVGEIIEANGARRPIDQRIYVETSCANGDCGYAYEGDMISFLHDALYFPVMFAYPCQSYPLGISDEATATLQACVDGLDCAGWGDG